MPTANNFWVACSGYQAGEMYDREIVIARSLKSAQQGLDLKHLPNNLIWGCTKEFSTLKQATEFAEYRNPNGIAEVLG